MVLLSHHLKKLEISQENYIKINQKIKKFRTMKIKYRIVKNFNKEEQSKLEKL